MAVIRALWRHPIKGHGRETLDRVTLTEGATIPWDRRWAVAHDAAKADGSEWAPCANFSRGSKAPALMAIEAQVDEASGTVTLSHPDQGSVTFDPDGDIAEFLEWTRPLMPENRAQSARILRVPGRGMTDTDYPSISLMNLTSGEDLGARMGVELSPKRWRCNIHFDGLPAWREFDWIGKTIRVGSAEIAIKEPIERCLATTANPATGTRDADTLGTLNADFGHQDFGIYGLVTRSGEVAVGGTIEVL